MDRLLSCKEYNKLIDIIYDSSDYKFASDEEKLIVDSALEKIYNFKEEYLINKELVNYPPTKASS